MLVYLWDCLCKLDMIQSRFSSCMDCADSAIENQQKTSLACTELHTGGVSAAAPSLGHSEAERRNVKTVT